MTTDAGISCAEEEAGTILDWEGSHLDFGDVAWSKITSNWTTVRDQGLTQHANWWPAIYSQACAASGETPDLNVLAFNETYEGKRADVHRRIPAE